MPIVFVMETTESTAWWHLCCHNSPKHVNLKEVARWGWGRKSASSRRWETFMLTKGAGLKRRGDTSLGSHCFNKWSLKQVLPIPWLRSPEKWNKRNTWILLNYFPPWCYTSKQKGKNPYNTQPFWLSILTPKVRASRQHIQSGYATSGPKADIYFPSLSALDSSNPVRISFLPSNLTETCYYGACEVWV